MERVVLWSMLWLYAQGGGVQFFGGSWQMLLQQAQKENKPIFVDFYTVWCGPCKLLERHTFSNAEVGAFANRNYLAYRVDAERGEGPRLANQYRVRAYPTIIFLDPRGEEVGRVVGFVDAPTFLSYMKKYHERFEKKKTEAPPSWQGFQEAYRVFFTDLTQRAWGEGLSQHFTTWRSAVEQNNGEQLNSIYSSLSSPASEVLRALAQWHGGQREAALYTLHHRLYQQQKLSPLQALWLAAYSLLYFEVILPEAVQWASYSLKSEPSGVAYLTQAALYYRLSRVDEAEQSLKQAQRDLPAEQPALKTLSALIAQR
ncbi:MAG: thioredoxin family protein [Bacteroidia bacterium]|nr:thioredoxin family protein [Bacteroidia bacterium]MDW8133902.1 thioredoxin family protein [Bacteroidia bacterium]